MSGSKTCNHWTSHPSPPAPLRNHACPDHYCKRQLSYQTPQYTVNGGITLCLMEKISENGCNVHDDCVHVCSYDVAPASSVLHTCTALSLKRWLGPDRTTKWSKYTSSISVEANTSPLSMSAALLLPFDCAYSTEAAPFCSSF